MLHYYKFHQNLFDPVPAKPTYITRPSGRGWPEACPPVRAANAFGFDLLANFDVTFVQSRGKWRVRKDIVIDSDFEYASSAHGNAVPLTQQYAWFWKRGQKLPHVISDNVYRHISNQVKVSTFLFMRTDPGEMLIMTDVPNMSRPWRAMTALIETDWYPASYPWHVVLELSRQAKSIRIRKGEPLCRVIPVRRGDYSCAPMSRRQFEGFFDRGQDWLEAHGRFEHEGTVDITHTYAKEQRLSRFIVRG
ncbi:MAG: DUF6065 family protein [Tepidisphaeraceae bacterium]